MASMAFAFTRRMSRELNEEPVSVLRAIDDALLEMGFWGGDNDETT